MVLAIVVLFVVLLGVIGWAITLKLRALAYHQFISQHGYLPCIAILRPRKKIFGKYRRKCILQAYIKMSDYRYYEQGGIFTQPPGLLYMHWFSFLGYKEVGVYEDELIGIWEQGQIKGREIYEVWRHGIR